LVCDLKEPAMKAWIGAATLAAVLAAGGAPAISPAPAATANPAVRTESAGITDLASQRRAHRAHRHTHHRHHPSHRATYSGPPHYLGRPIYYAPAAFPLGFDFGFGWW
jgi:hypothetical protein